MDPKHLELLRNSLAETSNRTITNPNPTTDEPLLQHIAVLTSVVDAMLEDLIPYDE